MTRAAMDRSHGPLAPGAGFVLFTGVEVTMGLRFIAIIAALSVLASASMAMAGRDACAGVTSCCAVPDRVQGCDRDPGRLERTCCCTIVPAPAATSAPVPAALERGAHAPLTMLPAGITHPAAGPLRSDPGRPHHLDRGPPPTSGSLLGQHVALLL